MTADDFELIQSTRRKAFRSDDLKEGSKRSLRSGPPCFKVNEMNMKEPKKQGESHVRL